MRINSNPIWIGEDSVLETSQTLSPVVFLVCLFHHFQICMYPISAFHMNCNHALNWAKFVRIVHFYHPPQIFSLIITTIPFFLTMITSPVAKRPKLSAGLSTGEHEPTRTWESLSHFERLPGEIMHKIIELVPDAVATVFTLRKVGVQIQLWFDIIFAFQTSRTMKLHGDTYVKMLRTIRPINKLKLSGLEYKRVPGKV